MVPQSDFNVWEGIYDSFAAAPKSGPGFSGPIWRERSMQATKDALAALETGAPLEYSMRHRNAVLPIAAAVMLQDRENLRILDFGGGLGNGYLVLRQVAPVAADHCDYTVSDVESICKAGRTLFGMRPGLAFRPELPRDSQFDLVHASSVLQYVERWQDVIAHLATFKPALLSLADIFAGPFQPFVTLQTYYDSRIPHWFLNEEVFVREVERHGYRLLTRTVCNVQVLGRHGPLPMDNLPPDRRIPRTHNFLFGRSETRQ